MKQHSETGKKLSDLQVDEGLSNKGADEQSTVVQANQEASNTSADEQSATERVTHVSSSTGTGKQPSAMQDKNLSNAGIGKQASASQVADGLSNADTHKKASPADKALLKKKRIIAIVSVVIVILLMGFVGYFVGKPLVQMAKEPQQFRAYVDSKGVWGQLIMIGIIALQIVVALIPGEPFEVGAGYAFGILQGTVLCLIGSALATAGIFALVKKYGRRFVELFVDTEKIDKWSFMQDESKLDGLLFILFLIPGTPKDILVYLAGLTPVTLPKFLLITTIARIPSVISSAIFGHYVNAQRYTVAIIVYGATAVLSLVGVLFYRKWSKTHVHKHRAAPHK